MTRTHNLMEMLAKSVKRSPQKIVLSWKKNQEFVSYTYQEVWGHIRDFAFGLKKLGVTTNTKVAILSNNRPEWFISDFATLSLGAVTVPIYPTLSKDQVHHILKDAEVEVLIVKDYEKYSTLENIPENVKNIIFMDKALGSSHYNFQEILDSGQEAGWDSNWGYHSVDKNQLATIVYTSGTTGVAKGVMLTHFNLLSNIEAILQYIIVSKEDQMLSMLPLSHILERTVIHFAPIYVGASIAYAEGINTVMDDAKVIKPTIMMSVPRLYEKIYMKVLEMFSELTGFKKYILDWCLAVADKNYEYKSKGFNWARPKFLRVQYEIANLLLFNRIASQLGGNIRFLGSGGASLDPKISIFFDKIGLPIIEAYGLTECSPGISANFMSHVKPGTVGKAFPGTEIKLSDDGELLVRSASVMAGYYNNEEKTKEALRDGWLHTGDIASIDDFGVLKIIDRKKNIIVLSNGKNVSPQPLEISLLTSKFIHQAVLLGNNKNYVTALIVPDFEFLKVEAQKNNWPYKSKEDFVSSQRINKLISDEIEINLKRFSKFEKPKKFKLLKEEFTVDKEELTPTLKVRLSKIEENYEAIIDSMYNETVFDRVAAAKN